MSEQLQIRRESIGLPAVSGPPSPAEWTAMRQQAQVILASGMAPKSVNTAEKILAIAMKGRELQIPPMQALSHVHVVEGRPALSAELMVALVQRAGHKIRVTKTDAESCTVIGVRLDDPGHPSEVTFSMDDAKRAGVAGKGPWKQYPQAMLRARAISALCRFAFADVLMGAAFVPEELGAVVNEEGEVIETPEPVEQHDEVEEAEVVEDDSELTELLDEIGEVHQKIPEHSRAPIGKVLDYVGDDLERARRSLAKLNKEYEASLSRGEAQAS